MSIARQLAGIEMVKPSAARLTVDHPDGSAIFAGEGDGDGDGDGDGVGLGVGVGVAVGAGVGVGLGDGATATDGDEQAAVRNNATMRIRRRNTGRC
jgi:hypothetical protein